MTQQKKHQIVVGMSGGVDSSVSALLLKQQGFDVCGLFMKNWEDTDDEGNCPAAEDIKDAISVCDSIGIPLDAANFSHQYWDRVFQYFLDEYRLGRTPNPDILCNKEIKFRAFLDYAIGQHEADAIATGHYARIRNHHGEYHLLKGKDNDKDQSYFLYSLDQSQLARSIFPVGELDKSEVRGIAQNYGFVNHDKKDSTGICFIGERKFKAFLNKYLPAQPGEIRTIENVTIGTHDGLMFHTIGQRKGLGIGGQREDSGQPWYVAGKNLQENILYVVQGNNHPMLFSDSLIACNLHWISGRQPSLPFHCHAKIRYRQQDQSCQITAVDDDRCRVTFTQPQRAVSPGQSVVFYRNEECLGGGIIECAEGAMHYFVGEVA